MFYIRNINKILRYHQDGRLIYNDKYESTIKAVKLDHPTLILIRKTWAQLAIVSSIVQVNNAIIDRNLRDEIISMCDLDLYEINRIKDSNLWKLLSEYSWFYKYYRCNW